MSPHDYAGELLSMLFCHDHHLPLHPHFLLPRRRLPHLSLNRPSHRSIPDAGRRRGKPMEKRMKSPTLVGVGDKGFALRRRTQVRISTPIIRVVELGLHSIMQGPHEFIGPTPLRPCLDVPTHSHAGEGIMGNADHLQSPRFLCVHVPLLGEVLGLCHHPTARAQPAHSNPEIHINLSILKLLTTAIPPLNAKAYELPRAIPMV